MMENNWTLLTNLGTWELYLSKIRVFFERQKGQSHQRDTSDVCSFEKKEE